jgi:acetyl esterase/lipase
MYKEDCTFEFEDKYHTILKKHEPKIHGAPSEHQMKSFEMDAAIFGKLYGERGADFLDMENNVPKLRETLDLFLKEVNPRHHPHFDDLKETVEIQVVDVEVEAGVTIDCTVVKPKALEGSDNAFYMYSHGGGGIFWDPTVLLPKLVDLATRWNMVIVGQNYRRAPEVKQPRGMLDTRAAFNFFHSNAEQYGFNKDRMCLGGFSGGGYEALGAAYQMAKNGETSKIRLLMLEMSMMTG